MLGTTATTATPPPPDTLQTAVQQKLARQNSEADREIERRRLAKTEGRRLEAAPGWPGWWMSLLRRRALIAVEICSFHRDSMISEMRVWATSRLP